MTRQSNFYEIHVTVKDKNDDTAFANLCRGMGVRPLFIEMDTLDDLKRDIMTSSCIEAIFPPLESVASIATKLRREGYEVVREKIETGIYEGAAYTDWSDYNYFEVHLQVYMDNTEQYQHLASIAAATGSFVSYVMSGTLIERKTFLTYRERIKCLQEEFVARVQAIKLLLFQKSIVVTSEKLEFAVFDSNRKHDDAWMRRA